MFEKEAEKYISNLDECRTKDLMGDAFKDGAEFGYNKANEWHSPNEHINKNNSHTSNYRYCAEIEEPKTRRMTNQELAWWLQEGKHREWKFKGLVTCVIHNTMCYPEQDAGDLVDTDILIRENGGEWHVPLVEVEE